MAISNAPFRNGSLSLALCLAFALSCGKGSTSGKDDKTSSGTEEDGSNSTLSKVAITGQLAITGVGLLESPKSLLLYQFSQGTVLGTPEAVTVDADGKFTAAIPKSDEALDFLVAQLELPKDQRDWEKMLPAIKTIMGDKASNISVDYLKSMTETQIQDGIADLAKSAKDAGRMTVLVAYTKSATGDLKAEASSFRFVGMPTPGNRSLNGFPNGSFKGDVDLGQITADAKDAKADRKADEALDMKAESLENLADLAKMLKIVKNYYMNKNWSVRPFYFWEGGTSKANVIDQWSVVDNVSYKGYGFYVPSIGSQGLTQADVCGGTSIVLTPPSAVNLVDNNNSTRSVTQFSNAGTSTGGSGNTCQGGQDFYGRMDNYGGQTSFMLNFGTGGSIQDTPEGLWTLKVGGVEKGAYDLASALPVDSNRKPLVFVPRAKFTSSAGKIVSADVEFYKWNGTAYTKVTDAQLMRSMFSDVSVTVGDDNDTANSARTKLNILDSGDLHVDFDGSITNDQGTVMNQAVPIANMGSHGFAISFDIGDISYRTEFR